MGFKDAGKPHFLGHRDRLRQRFRDGGDDALPDYELLELILFRALPRRDTKLPPSLPVRRVAELHRIKLRVQ